MRTMLPKTTIKKLKSQPLSMPLCVVLHLCHSWCDSTILLG